ncbi:hypothetical protein HBH56_067590 [Parastagonospora nodorum]|uniref:Pre-mRNA-splicing factor n=1 Tax=Phaeosphaeria nodorum (strain SN15 / ATCC MYA-4574 / FGSC 10173) TaxID=321614 RepID=A0A7U2EYT4_PHANO|nr:hypothetical protein HBH56_067590 [Parastagonospora nodorum]QRC93439.1 hypothetical protein JI435_036650 [Parastagonospora nodorum SN15]KAH3932570.1 hypothetical protein HBH54_080520 [Parastagonospora nodorum]KAH4143777.1 hypothetical protein HBH45_035540 [Parastagonospora nodorum]KAH4165627.1 hypothetical protein HBH44_067820 [Parastagonospora nodorum]
MAAPKEGGFKMSLGGLKGKVGLKAAPAKKDVKRPRLALGDDEEDDSGKQQEISGWDAAEGGAVDVGGPKEKEAPRVIPALPNRNWREDARRRQLAKAPHTKAQNTEVTEQMEQPQIQYGLTILKKEDQQDNAAEEEPAPAEPMEDVQDNLTEEQRLEKKALDALINGKPTDEGLVIPLHNDEDAFQSDLRSAPDAPTLDAYEATPIEGFGAALLRGMGWKDSDAAGKNGAPAKIKQVKPRPALLGIGAKEDAAAGVELGDFKGNRGKGKNKQQSYNPVALRNKKTGEVITEDELKAKLEQQDMVQEEPKRKREDERRSDKERDRRRGKDDYDDRRDRRKDKYRDEEYDSERRREKRRDRDDDHDSERRRDRRRDEDYDSERRRDKRRERSRSPSDKKRDRYRSRSRDSKRDRDRRDRSRDPKRRREYDDDREERRRRH